MSGFLSAMGWQLDTSAAFDATLHRYVYRFTLEMYFGSKLSVTKPPFGDIPFKSPPEGKFYCSDVARSELGYLMDFAAMFYLESTLVLNPQRSKCGCIA